MDLGHVYYWGCHLKNAAVDFHPGHERYKFALDSTTYVSYLQFDSCTFGIKTMRSLHIPRASVFKTDTPAVLERVNQGPVGTRMYK